MDEHAYLLNQHEQMNSHTAVLFWIAKLRGQNQISVWHCVVSQSGIPGERKHTLHYNKLLGLIVESQL